MCKRNAHPIDTFTLAAEGAYEGQTVRLDTRGIMAGQGRAQRAHRWCGGFPWWTLWMIWPLFGLVKWLAPLYLAAASAVLARLSAVGAAPIVAIVLIAAGLWLIRRK